MLLCNGDGCEWRWLALSGHQPGLAWPGAGGELMDHLEAALVSQQGAWGLPDLAWPDSMSEVMCHNGAALRSQQGARGLPESLSEVMCHNGAALGPWRLCARVSGCQVAGVPRCQGAWGLPEPAACQA